MNGQFQVAQAFRHGTSISNAAPTADLQTDEAAQRSGGDRQSRIRPKGQGRLFRNCQRKNHARPRRRQADHPVRQQIDRDRRAVLQFAARCCRTTSRSKWRLVATFRSTNSPACFRSRRISRFCRRPAGRKRARQRRVISATAPSTRWLRQSARPAWPGGAGHFRSLSETAAPLFERHSASAGE